jgi:hypothetical protein
VRCYKSVALQSSTRESHGSCYFGWKLEQGVFRYFEHPRHLEPEKALEGKYVIQSEEPDLGPVQAVEAYKELSEVEGSLRQLKDLVEMRPIYHHRSKRVRAHFRRSVGLPAKSRVGEKAQSRRRADIQRSGIGSLAHHARR